MKPATVEREPDLTDRIANALPLSIRADFYRELLYCRSLPESDELLRILRIMQFLTLLIEEAPSRMADERAAIAKLIDRATNALNAIGTRLDALPEELASGIHPETISAKINESLRQQFVATTIPQSGAALARSAQEIDESVQAFVTVARTIQNAHTSVAAEAAKAIQKLDSAVRSAARSAETATEALHQQASELTWINLSLGALAMFALGYAVAFFALRG
jgi:hypothetical protein